MNDTVTSLIAEELKVRAQAVSALQSLVKLHAQIDASATQADRIARSNPAYRRISTSHSAFIIRIRRESKSVKAALGFLSGLRLPTYTSPVAQIKAYLKGQEMIAARRERLAARREQLRQETNDA